MEGTQPISDSFELMEILLLQHHQIAHHLLQRLLTPRDRIELLISFSQSETRAERSEFLIVSAQAASLRFSD